ncbi:MAG: hypothetical protein ACRDJW_12535 [Thermomicrobiales bacterium]
MTSMSTIEVAPELLIDHALAQVEADPRVQRALTDLRNVIRTRYPEASFEVARRTDPAGIYLRATVDDDLDAVLDAVMDRLLEVQVDERLPVHVLPVRP